MKDIQPLFVILVSLLCCNLLLLDQGPTPYIELSGWTITCSVILPFGVMVWAQFSQPTYIIDHTGEWQDATYAWDDWVLNSPDYRLNIIVYFSTFSTWWISSELQVKWIHQVQPWEIHLTDFHLVLTRKMGDWVILPDILGLFIWIGVHSDIYMLAIFKITCKLQEKQWRDRHDAQTCQWQHHITSLKDVNVSHCNQFIDWLNDIGIAQLELTSITELSAQCAYKILGLNKKNSYSTSLLHMQMVKVIQVEEDQYDPVTTFSKSSWILSMPRGSHLR